MSDDVSDGWTASASPPRALLPHHGVAQAGLSWSRQTASVAWKNRVTRSIASRVIGSVSEKSKPWALPG